MQKSKTAAPQHTSSANRVLLLGVDHGQDTYDTSLNELSLLAQSAGLTVAAKLSCKRSGIDPATFIGSGKVEEIRQLLALDGITEVIFDSSLSPAQQRNLERALQCAVYDRVFLILEIFARRATSLEGKLQVELARLQYLSTRLVRRWSHLERQRGGIGARGGPGETQIELDRRMITHSLQRTKQRLREVSTRRDTQRLQRQRKGLPTVSIVGYTNAGKSTLFNSLVKARAYAADQLFATLDTTTRQWYIQANPLQTVDADACGHTDQATGRMLALSDTVGFIHNLPHTLIQAFQATLREAVDADLLLHVVDAASPQVSAHIDAVQQALTEIGADHIPQILVFNKADLLPTIHAHDPAQWPRPDHYVLSTGMWVPRVYVSALTKQGLQTLRATVLEQLAAPHVAAEAAISHKAAGANV